MNISYSHESVRLTGRWDRGERCATTTTTGAYIEFAFEGRMALARFDVVSNASPLLHLWIQLDGGVMTEAPIDSFLRVIAPDDGAHVCRIIYKGGTEQDRRWYAPLTGKVSFIGVQTDKPIPIAPDTRKTVEFVGDSITEGVLIDVDYNTAGDPTSTYVDAGFRCWQDDACATYAWLTAEAMGWRPIVMGYGAVGATHAGQGLVPKAALAYPYNFDGSPITHESADYIIINHGANDRGAKTEVYLSEYENLLDVIRARNPQSVIVSLSAFCGAHHEALGEMIERYNEKNGCHVHFIDSFGWIPEEPLHPLRDGHKTVSVHLVEKLKKIL
ncbi:MAG: hypothetical protein IJW29_08180 [Clostridia bacterium]|nr:hypothetical protein [Clostridia bacterium]